MKKYALIEWRKDGDRFENLFDTEKEALIHADDQWNKYLTESEKAGLDVFAVMYGELDEDGCFDLDTASVIKSFK